APGRVLIRLIIQSPNAFVPPIIFTKAVNTPSIKINSSRKTFPVFKAASSTNTSLNEIQIKCKDSLMIKLAMKKAEATIPTPKDNNTRLVNNTIAIAKIGGNSDQKVFTIHYFLLFFRIFLAYISMAEYPLLLQICTIFLN